MKIRLLPVLVLPFLCILFPISARADLESIPTLTLDPIANVPDDPVALTHAGDSRLFITLRDGRILIHDGNQILGTPFLDIRALVNSSPRERGLLSVAFHPDYPAVPFFFVDYTDLAGDTVIARYRVDPGDPNRAQPGSALIILEIAQPFSNHNGGQLQFGPDGYLYIGMGDGGSANDPQCNAQNDSSLLGKILRLDVDGATAAEPYRIPPDNPFVGPGAPRDEIWALGLRNPWRFAFDRGTGHLYIADVGQSAREEIDFQPAASAGGENYGWKRMEGNLCLGSVAGCSGTVPGCSAVAFTPPAIDYEQSAGRCAVVGGTVYRGIAIPQLAGIYLYGDFCTGDVWAAERQGGAWQTRLLSVTLPSLTSFGENAAGEIYLASQTGGVFRLEGPSAPGDPGALAFASTAVDAAEEGPGATLTVRRTNGDSGAVSVGYETLGGTAEEGVDYLAASGVLDWADGDSGDREIEVELVDDAEIEPDESFRIRLSAPTGGAVLGPLAETVVTVRDDDLPAGPCVPGPQVLCLLDDRFRVTATWRDFEGGSGAANAETFTDESGWFWFFNDLNTELVVKVRDACVDPFQHFWVFAAGLTNVEVELLVADTEEDVVRRYRNELSTPFQPIQDTSAFATCP